MKVQDQTIEKAKVFFRDTIANNHIKNLKKLSSLEKFNYNPFLLDYLSIFLDGKSDPKSQAKVLVYARILGTSINTSFGQNIQKFCSEVLSGYGSTTSGIDLEFIDQLDKRRKFAQIKAGPNTLNNDDVETIEKHFTAIKNLGRTNNIKIGYGDLIIGVLYGEPKELSPFYKKLDQEYPVYAGKDFWHRLTGNENFYSELIDAFGEVAKETKANKIIEDVIKKLSIEIQKKIAEKII